MRDAEFDARFLIQVEPIMAALERLTRELGEMAGLLADTTAAFEPVAAEVVRSRGELEVLKAQRLDVQAWSPGVYRQGTVVQHFLGQYFEAVADTATEPGDGVTWRRLGNHGFRYRGELMEGGDYSVGDLVASKGNMLLHTGGELAVLAARGRVGKPGELGPAGAPGKDGAPGAPGRPGEPGASAIDLVVERGVIYLVRSDGKRTPIAFEETKK